MTFSFKAGLASAGMAFALSLAGPATAADLGDGGWGRGSIKDYSPAMASSPVGPCYFRADTGYSLSNDPHLNWNAVPASGNTTVVPSTFQSGPISNTVTSTSVGNSWLAEAGYGCGSGSRGLRADFTLGYHGDRTVAGTTSPAFWGQTDPAGNVINQTSRIVSTLSTYTAMANLYYDLGNFRGVVPYVGAGVGLAYHRMGDYSFPGLATNPANYAIHGANDVSLAWGLMAGIGYQISDRAILDIGYRYIDLGTAETGRNDNTGSGQLSRLTANNLTANEFKIGLRYHLGALSGGNCCAAPLK